MSLILGTHYENTKDGSLVHEIQLISRSSNKHLAKPIN